MRARKLLALVAITLASQAVFTVARAQEPDATTMAKADVAAGEKHFRAGEFHEAYVRFKSAAAVYPSPHVRANMVLAGSRSSYPPERVESARTGRALLREGKLQADDVAKVNDALSRLTPLLGRIEVRGHESETVRIDGATIDSATLLDPFDVAPGKHEVLVATESHVVDVAAGTTATVTVGTTAVVTEPSKPSKPAVVAVAPTRETKRVPRDGRPIVMGVLGGVAVGSLATGLVTFVVASSARSDAKDTSLSSAERNDAIDRGNQMRTISMITTYAGIGLGVAALVPLVIWPKKTVNVGAFHVTPLVGPGHLGLHATF